jgi:hypothetical protein
MKIEKLQMNQFTMQVWDNLWEYNIRNWIALNSENFVKYQAVGALTEKIAFLENILKANILSFAKGIEWTVEKPIEVKITDIVKIGTTTLKGQKVSSFDLDFKTNVFIPNHIGLGKSVSLGFGNVMKKFRNDN